MRVSHCGDVPPISIEFGQVLHGLRDMLIEQLIATRRKTHVTPDDKAVLTKGINLPCLANMANIGYSQIIDCLVGRIDGEQKVQIALIWSRAGLAVIRRQPAR